MVGLILSLLSSGSLHAAGFSSGDQFTSTYVSGRVRVFCQQGGYVESATYRCEADLLDPAEFDYFVSDSDVEATSVTLTNRVGKKDTKQTRDYSTEKTRSKQRFNLWIRSLTQRPLLKLGENTVKYEMKKGKKVAESGEFNVMVNEGEERMCRYATFNSFDLNDCRSFNPYICDQYFQRQDYCQ